MARRLPNREALDPGRRVDEWREEASPAEHLAGPMPARSELDLLDARPAESTGLGEQVVQRTLRDGVAAPGAGRFGLYDAKVSGLSCPARYVVHPPHAASARGRCSVQRRTKARSAGDGSSCSRQARPQARHNPALPSDTARSRPAATSRRTAHSGITARPSPSRTISLTASI